MTNRRKFIQQVAAAGIASSLPTYLYSQEKSSQKMIWADLIHLSYNMWEDHVPLKYRDENFICTTCQEAREWAHGYRPNLTFDEMVWNALLKEMAGVGMNMVVIDLGDAIKYESHPEIAVKNAWTPEKLKAELAKMRKLGLEPIPKLNFATTHDIWLGKYARMVSSDTYYAVCRDLINEVIALFDHPRFFHLGMDEETAAHQVNQDYAVIRQNDLWWGDLYFFISEVEKNGVRPWIWSDYAWHKPELFFRKMPKSVLQSNWYYGSNFDINTLSEQEKPYIKLYDDLEKYGYDQVPTGSNHSVAENFESTVDYCKKVIDPARLYGFMTAPWRPTLSPCQDRHKEAISQVARAIKKS
ncbi:MAG: Tat pathway signal protein [Bacteroidales bacterium]|nr:Tat pathway signal protein [Bacteroidales bacterium]MBK8882555.1 Tat pathway signal protein [Bacteroidales bacterium]